MISWKRKFFLVFFASITMLGCGYNPSTDSSSLPYIAQQKEISNIYLDALLVGRLEIVDDCLRIVVDEEISYLPIWPRNFSIESTEKHTELFDATGSLVGRLGNILRISGGEIPPPDNVQLPVPENCSGPYWLVGSEITIIE